MAEHEKQADEQKFTDFSLPHSSAYKGSASRRSTGANAFVLTSALVCYEHLTELETTLAKAGI
jgi:hypothetical protein